MSLVLLDLQNEFVFTGFQYIFTYLFPTCLQMVVTRGVESMEPVLGWDTARTSALVQACEAELTRRLQQVQALQSIRSITQPDSSQQSSEKSAEEEGEETPAQGRRN